MLGRKRKNYVSKGRRRKVPKTETSIESRQNEGLLAGDTMHACHNEYSCSSITLMHTRAAISSVTDYPEVQVYNRNAKGKFTYHVSSSSNFELTNPNLSKCVPVLQQLEYIANDMVKSNVLELNWGNDTSDFYDYQGVVRLKEILRCKMVKGAMEKGKRFLFNFTFDIPHLNTFMTEISQKNLQTFWNIINQESPNSRSTLNKATVATESLCSVMSLSSSLNEEILDLISNMLNRNRGSKSHRTVVANIKELNENTPLFIIKIKQLFGNTLSDVNILLYTNIIDEEIQPHMKKEDYSAYGSTQEHYVFAVYSVEENQVLYVDTLAKPVPRSLFTSLVNLSKCLGKGIIHFGLCHEEKASVEHSECRRDCLYPYQRCNTVGGIAVIIGMSIFTLDRLMFQVMTGQVPCEDYANKVAYLKDITSHSHFLRLVVIDWIISGVIDLSQIYKKTNVQMSNPQLIEEKTSSVKKFEDELNTDKLTRSSPVIKVQSGTHELCLVKKPDLNGTNISYSKTKIISRTDDVDVPTMVHEVCTGKLVRPILKCNVRPIETKSVDNKNCEMTHSQYVINIKVSQGQFPVSYNEVHHLMFGRPGICFKKKEWSYCIECNLTTGTKRYKFFKCSLGKGRDDEEALNQIRDFFTVNKFVSWMEDDVKPRCKINTKIAQTELPDKKIKTEKCDSDFDPELIIILNEYANSFAENKPNMNISRKVESVKVIPETVKDSRQLSATNVKIEEPSPDSLILPSSPEHDAIAGNEVHKFSSANTIRVGCSHGRIPLYFGEVQHLLIGRPTLAFRKKKCCYSLECTFYNGVNGYKNFSCSKDKGREDLDTLNRINEFLRAEKFTPWLKENLRFKHKNKRKGTNDDLLQKKKKKSMVGDPKQSDGLLSGNEDIIVIESEDPSKDIGEDTMHICMEINDMGVIDKYVTSVNTTLESDNRQKSTILDFERIKEFIVGKPKIHFRKAKNLYRLECLLWNGNKVHKNFPALPLGKEKTLVEIKDFLKSDKAVHWVQNDDDDSWIFQYEVKAGIDTRHCLDKIPFDVTKHFIYQRNIVKPEYSKETCWVSVTQNKKWGKTHRYDETYRIISSTASYDPNTVVAYVYLNCASKTNECRTACGALVRSLTCFENVCDNCGLSLDTGKECYHCKTTTSSQWYYKGEPGELCATCYTYRKRKGHDRPVEFKAKGSGNSRKIHHEHLQCHWRMKLEMKLNSLNTWNVYESSENINYHVTLPIQENKRPALGIRDMWDKLRVSRKATSLQIHSIESKSKIVIANKDDDNNPNAHSLSQIKARCELVDKHHSCKNSVDEPYQVILSEEDHVDGEPAFQVTQDNKKLQRQLQLEATEANHTRICGICFEEGINPPFTCITKRDLDAHKNKMHNGYGDLCALCYKEMGMVVRFEDSRELLQHLNKHKVKYH